MKYVMCAKVLAVDCKFHCDNVTVTVTPYSLYIPTGRGPLHPAHETSLVGLPKCKPNDENGIVVLQIS